VALPLNEGRLRALEQLLTGEELSSAERPPFVEALAQQFQSAAGEARPLVLVCQFVVTAGPERLPEQGPEDDEPAIPVPLALEEARPVPVHVRRIRPLTILNPNESTLSRALTEDE
jgi:hypothetical protein